MRLTRSVPIDQFYSEVHSLTTKHELVPRKCMKFVRRTQQRLQLLRGADSFSIPPFPHRELSHPLLRAVS